MGCVTFRSFCILISYTILYMKLDRGWEGYTVCCTGSERSVLAWYKAGIRKLKGVRTGFGRGICLCAGSKETLY
jgi:hypothetical protein